MANKVRGLTIPIEADTSKFNAGLRGSSKETKAAQTELNALKKGLALEYDDGKFKRAQSLAQDVLDTTAQKADVLRARLKHLENAGAIDTDEYAKVRTELAKTETKAIEAKQQIEQLNKIKLDALTAKVDKVAAGFNSAASATRGLSLAAGGTIAALGGLGMAARNVGDEIGTAALAAGMTAEELQKMRYVALQTDVDTEKMSKGLSRRVPPLLTWQRVQSTPHQRRCRNSISTFCSSIAPTTHFMGSSTRLAQWTTNSL